MINGRSITLAIESSCDETSVALLADGRTVLSNIISSQIDIHKAYGGVVPEIASRHHLDNINMVTDNAFREASAHAQELGLTDKQIGMDDVDLIGVTYGPGLVGALLIGVATAKAYAVAAEKPLVGVHHILGHISANFIEYEELEPPFMSLVVSGGHTSIVEVDDYTKCRVLGRTRDDAAGEAFDKVARVLGLGYPGGPLIDSMAKEGDPAAVEFKRVFLEKDSLDFSFSGLKTGVINYMHTEAQAGRDILAGKNSVSRADVAASFQQAVMDVIVTKSVGAAVREGRDRLAVAGGVAANSRLRQMMQEACDKEGIKLYIPRPVLCTDNAAMIGCAAYYRYKAGYRDGLDMDAVASLPLG